MKLMKRLGLLVLILGLVGLILGIWVMRAPVTGLSRIGFAILLSGIGVGLVGFLLFGVLSALVKMVSPPKKGISKKGLTYRLEFDPKLDFEATPIWVMDASHCVPPWTPIAAWLWARTCGHGGSGVMEEMGLPYNRTTWMRLINGAVYYGFSEVEDEEEARQREPKFKEWITPFIEDYENNWEGVPERELMAIWERFKKFDVENASNFELWLHIEDCFNSFYRMWYLHVKWIYTSWCPYVLLESVCKQFAGIDDNDPTFLKLVTGFDNKAFQVDRRLWQLGRRATELGLRDTFLQSQNKEVIPQLETTDAGRKWLSEFREFLDEDGWRSQRKLDFTGPTWIEDPTPAIDIINLYLRKGEDFSLDKQREKAAEERKAAEKEVLEKMPDEMKEYFIKLLGIAQQAGIHSESHVYYCEDYAYALTRRALLELGRRYAKAGAFDSPEDIWFLLPEEMQKVIYEPQHFDLRPFIKERRKEYDRWQKKPNPPFLLKEGVTPDQVMPHLERLANPIFVKSVLGGERKAGPELKADLYGQVGSPGVAEGKAKVILDENELFKVEEGDILVAANTGVSWTPVFNLINGAVVDMGGTLAHAAVVGREFGIPVVTNTLFGTRRIKTGQRIRVDGNMGVVYYLDK
jgi:phosphohistidine swiveling domain-containing protein